MAVLKRGFCTHCQGDEKLRIFNVNKTAENCHCPHCTHLMEPKEAIENYRNMISHHLKRAARYLFDSTEYLLAYQEFAHIIDLDDSIKVAYFGRILALVYLSTLRTSKINFAFLMHRQQAPKFHYQETMEEYFHFLLLLLDALDIYINKMKRRLTSRGVFYDTDCVILYLKRLDEIRSYKDFIASEADYFLESNKGPNKDLIKEVVGRVKEADEECENIFHEIYQTANGLSYKFVTFGDNSMPTINLCKNPDAQKVRRVKKISLYPKDNKKSRIRDDIYLNNLPLSRLVMVSIPLATIFLVLGIGAVVLAMLVDNAPIKFSLFGVAAILASVSLMLFILHFSFKNRLKKNYYNGTNPFILR